MAKKKKSAKQPVGNLKDPKGFGVRFETYADWMRVKNYSRYTVDERRVNFSAFVRWCKERGLSRPEEITRPILERYARSLLIYRTPRTGKPLAPSSQHARLRAVRGFFRFLTKQNILLHNPASELESPRLPNRLPQVLTVAEVETVLSQPDIDSPIGVRDRAMMETLYSTGIRRMELVALKLTDINDERGVVSIFAGKGGKDRVVPIGERALDWIDRYCTEIRPIFAGKEDDGFLFVTKQGEPLAPEYTSELVRRYVAQAEIGKTGSCHLFRHTMATLMLEGGADIRLIQEILGHANLQTTQLYTRVSIRHLKATHEASHPSAKRGRARDVGDAG